MRKWTILISVLNTKDHTTFVYNKGIDENTIIKMFKSNGFEKVISANEIKLMLSSSITNGIIEGVYDMTNSYNRDQKEINKIKENIEKRLEAKGYEIINHCDYAPNFDSSIIDRISESRNYLNNLAIQIENHKKDLEKIEDRISNADKECEYYERNLLERKNTYNKFKDYTEQVEEKKKELDKLIERYRNGEKYIMKMENELPEEIKQLKEEKKNLTISVDSIRNDVNCGIKELERLTEIISENNRKISRLKNTEEKIIEEIRNIQADEVARIMKKITDKYKELAPKEILLEKLKTTIKMYLLNNRQMPEYELEYFINLGISKNEIEELLNIIHKNINE